MAKVLLVYPNPAAIHPRYPNALLPLAAVLLKRGHKIWIFDGQFEDYTELSLSNFDCVGISIMTGPQISSALKIAKWIRQKNPSMTLIWGGVHASLIPEQTAKNEYVDVVVRGEGEETLLELIECIEANRAIDHVKGITYRKNGVIYSTPDREYINMDQLPFLPYDLLSAFHRYSNIKRKILYLQTSRGCPHKCGFCYAQAVHKGKWRAMSPARVIEEIKDIHERFKPDIISLVDDEFFVSKRRVEEICRGLIQTGLKINWGGSGHYGYAYKYDKDFFDLLKKSGCTAVSFGGESGSSAVLESISKGITVEQMKITVRKFKENDIHSTVNFMAGFPEEKKEDIFKTFDLIDKLTAIDPSLMANSISIYTPFPNTPLYQQALDNGFKQPRSLQEWGRYFYNDANNLPWLDRSTKELLKTISLLTECEFNRKGQFKSRNLFEDSPLKKTLYKILSCLAKFRWKHRFFRFPIEWRLLDIVLRITKSGER